MVFHERDLAVRHLTTTELTSSERCVLETIANGGRKIHGQIDFEDTIACEKFQQLLSRNDAIVE